MTEKNIIAVVGATGAQGVSIEFGMTSQATHQGVPPYVSGLNRLRPHLGVDGKSFGRALQDQQRVRANQLQFKYLVPFHVNEATEILGRSKKTICVEGNYTGQFARHLRAETGFSVHDQILKYDCEPFEPRQIVEEVKAILNGKARSRDLTMDEARDMAYHYIRSRLGLSEANFPHELHMSRGALVGIPLSAIRDLQ